MLYVVAISAAAFALLVGLRIIPLSLATLVFAIVVVCGQLPVVIGGSWLMSKSERDRGPFFVLVHDRWMVELPRSGDLFPAGDVRTVVRRYYLENSGDGKAPHVELSLVVVRGEDGEVLVPFLRAQCAAVMRRVLSQDKASRIGARLAMELRVGVRDVAEGVEPPRQTLSL